MLDKDKFAECGGCGNLFDTTNETEVALLDTHNCETFNTCSDECGCGDPECETIK
jgi:hypothetical protein